MPVALLCHFDGISGSTTFADTSTLTHTLTATSATVNTISPKFGTGSGDFTAASAARIDTGNAADFNLGSGQFTVEAWGYFTSAPGTNTVGVLTQFGGASNLGWFLGMASGALAFYYSTTGSDNPNVGASYTPALNTWIHLAADRDASHVLRVYANGVVIASATVVSTIFASTQTCLIGNDHNNNRNFPGRLDEARITTGTAMYGGAFTPPTAPFPDGPFNTESSKLVSYAVLQNTAEESSKLVTYAVLQSSIEISSKFVSYAVLASPATRAFFGNVFREALISSTGLVRFDTIFREALLAVPGRINLGNIFREALVYSPTAAYLSLIAREVLIRPNPQPRLSGLFREVLLSTTILSSGRLRPYLNISS